MKERPMRKGLTAEVPDEKVQQGLEAAHDALGSIGRQPNRLNEEILLCAQVNFENLERVVPGLSEHPYYRIAKAQLDEGLGGRPVEEALLPEVGNHDY